MKTPLPDGERNGPERGSPPAAGNTNRRTAISEAKPSNAVLASLAATGGNGDLASAVGRRLQPPSGEGVMTRPFNQTPIRYGASGECAHRVLSLSCREAGRGEHRRGSQAGPPGSRLAQSTPSTPASRITAQR